MVIVKVKLTRVVRGNFVTLIQGGMHLKTYLSGQKERTVIFYIYYIPPPQASESNFVHLALLQKEMNNSDNFRREH